MDEATRGRTIDDACTLAVSIANDSTHGYSQANRWGPDYDCSSFLIHVWQTVGVPVRDAGASYTGNMKAAFLSCGFADVTDAVNLVTGAGCEAGDILLNERDHVAMSLGNGHMVWASTSGGHPEPGDQTGKEIRTGAFYSFPWDCCLRYISSETIPKPAGDTLADDTRFAIVIEVPELRRGDCGFYVQVLQMMLVLHKITPDNTVRRDGTCDGEFGDGTEAAVRQFQSEQGLPVTGVCTPQTFEELFYR